MSNSLSVQQLRELHLAAELTRVQYERARELAREIDPVDDGVTLNTVALMLAINGARIDGGRRTP